MKQNVKLLFWLSVAAALLIVWAGGLATAAVIVVAKIFGVSPGTVIAATGVALFACAFLYTCLSITGANKS